MNRTMSTVLVIGATGQIGRVVVQEALAQGAAVRAQSRDAQRARRALAAGAEVVEADPTSVAQLRPLVQGVDGVVLTHGGDTDGRGGQSFYDVVSALIEALSDAPEVPVALMTSMRTSQVPAWYGFVEWKRRAERLLRASGRPYTIVRPGWFGYQEAWDHRVDLLQGDTVTSQRGVDTRHVAQVLLAALCRENARGRTLEVFSASGEPTEDLASQLDALLPDEPGALDGVLDADHLALQDEPRLVQDDVARFSR